MHRSPRSPRLTHPRLAVRLAAVVLVIAVSGPARLASAHATVVHATPAAGSTVETAPARVRIWFSAPIEAAGSTLAVLDAKGRPVDRRDGAPDSADPTRYSVSLPAALPKGVYTVRWKALTGDDGAQTQGEFRFGIGEAVPPPPPVAAVPWAGVDARIGIEAPRDGARLEDPDVPLVLQLHGITLIAMGSSSDPRPGTIGGHLHVFVDGTMLGMVSTDRGLVLHDLGDGPHEIVVSLSTPEHLPYDPPIEARTHVTVTGSSAKGPASLSEQGPRAVPPPAASTGLAAHMPSWPVMAAVLLAALLLLGTVVWKITSRWEPPEDDAGR